MPDFFVPADTSGNSEYFTAIYRKGLIYTFAYAYADENRDVLTELKDADAFDQFLEEKNVLKDFILYAEEKGVPYSETGMTESRLIINTQLKAYIARNIIGEEGYYPVIKRIDKTLLKAIEISHQNLLVENTIHPTGNSQQ